MIKFNEEDFICCSEFKCEQDYDNFVEAVCEMGYKVFSPNYKQDVTSGNYQVMVIEDGEFVAGRSNYRWTGKAYKLEEILFHTLPEEAQALRKILLRAVKDIEDGKLTSVNDFLESI